MVKNNLYILFFLLIIILILIICSIIIQDVSYKGSKGGKIIKGGDKKYFIRKLKKSIKLDNFFHRKELLFGNTIPEKHLVRLYTTDNISYKLDSYFANNTGAIIDISSSSRVWNKKEYFQDFEQIDKDTNIPFLQSLHGSMGILIENTQSPQDNQLIPGKIATLGEWENIYRNMGGYVIAKELLTIHYNRATSPSDYDNTSIKSPAAALTETQPAASLAASLATSSELADSSNNWFLVTSNRLTRIGIQFKKDTLLNLIPSTSHEDYDIFSYIDKNGNKFSLMEIEKSGNNKTYPKLPKNDFLIFTTNLDLINIADDTYIPFLKKDQGLVLRNIHLNGNVNIKNGTILSIAELKVLNLPNCTSSQIGISYSPNDTISKIGYIHFNKEPLVVLYKILKDDSDLKKINKNLVANTIIKVQTKNGGIILSEYYDTTTTTSIIWRRISSSPSIPEVMVNNINDTSVFEKVTDDTDIPFLKDDQFIVTKKILPPAGSHWLRAFEVGNIINKTIENDMARMWYNRIISANNNIEPTSSMDIGSGHIHFNKKIQSKSPPPSSSQLSPPSSSSQLSPAPSSSQLSLIPPAQLSHVSTPSSSPPSSPIPPSSSSSSSSSHVSTPPAPSSSSSSTSTPYSLIPAVVPAEKIPLPPRLTEELYSSFISPPSPTTPLITPPPLIPPPASSTTPPSSSSPPPPLIPPSSTSPPLITPPPASSFIPSSPTTPLITPPLFTPLSSTSPSSFTPSSIIDQELNKLNNKLKHIENKANSINYNNSNMKAKYQQSIAEIAQLENDLKHLEATLIKSNIQKERYRSDPEPIFKSDTIKDFVSKNRNNIKGFQLKASRFKLNGKIYKKDQVIPYAETMSILDRLPKGYILTNATGNSYFHNE